MSPAGADNRAGFIPIGVTDGYDKWATRYDDDPNPLIAVEEGIVLNLVGDAHGLQVLDLGCGTGRYCLLLAERGARVVGIDLSAAMLRQALPKRVGFPFDLARCSLDRLCLPSRHFDLVVCALTLNHVERLPGMFREITRVLRGGGRIILSDFHPYWIVFGHGYTEFFDHTGQEYRIACFPHLFEDYWRLFERFGLRIEEWREPKIDGVLIERFPGLEAYRGIPLAIIFELSCAAADH